MRKDRVQFYPVRKSHYEHQTILQFIGASEEGRIASRYTHDPEAFDPKVICEGGDIVSVIPKPSLWIKIRKAYSRSVGNYQAVTLPQGWFMKKIFFVAKSAMFSF